MGQEFEPGRAASLLTEILQDFEGKLDQFEVKLDTIIAKLDNPGDPALVDITDRWSRQLGQIDLVRVLNDPMSPANPVIVGVYDALGNRMPPMDAAARPGYIDVIDRATRLLGVVYGSQAQPLLQRAASFDLIVQLRHAGVEIDPRDVSDRWARQVGQVDLARVIGAALSAANPVISGIFDAAGNRMPSMDAAARAGYVDPTDRWARQLGLVDLSRVLGVALSAANPVIAAIYDALGNRMPSMDVAARRGYVGVVGSAGAVFPQEPLAPNEQQVSINQDNVGIATEATLSALNTKVSSGGFTPVTTCLVNNGDTTLVAAPGAGHKIRVLGYKFSNRSTTSTSPRVSLRFGAGSLVFTATLSSCGGMVNWQFGSHLEKPYWEGGDNVALIGNLSGAFADGVDVTVTYYTT